MLWAMEAMGHDVRLVLDGETALKEIKTFVPGVVLCDISMPGMLGYEVCEKMRADPRLSNTLFIAQTGLNSPSSKALTHKAGFHYHMVKPIDINALFETVYLDRLQAGISA